MSIVTITAGSIAIRVKTLDTPTAAAITAACPFDSSANTWGDEVYFSIPINAPRESDAKVVVQAGEVAYWPDGEAIAIGFGATPISQGEEIRLASPCNIWGHALDDVRTLSVVKPGSDITVKAT